MSLRVRDSQLRPCIWVAGEMVAMAKPTAQLAAHCAAQPCEFELESAAVVACERFPCGPSAAQAVGIGTLSQVRRIQ